MALYKQDHYQLLL